MYGELRKGFRAVSWLTAPEGGGRILGGTSQLLAHKCQALKQSFVDPAATTIYTDDCYARTVYVSLLSLTSTGM
jgi:hypothetical protein